MQNQRTDLPVILMYNTVCGVHMDYNALFIDVPLEHIYDLFDKLAYKTVSMYFGFCLLFPGNLS